MLNRLANGYAATGNKNREVDDCDKAGKIPEQNAAAITLHQADGKKDNRNSGKCVAEGDKAERRHEQDGSQYQGAVIQNSHKAIGGQPLEAMRATHSLQAVKPYESTLESSAELIS